MSPIRVLCVFSSLDRGGAETMCMNLYRHIDRSKVQFDFVKHVHEKGDFEDEITSLGGKIYEAPRYKIYNSLQYKKWWKKHLTEHPEHQIVHGHFFGISAVYFHQAKKMGRITIGHSHCTPSNEKTIKNWLKTMLIKRIEHEADYGFACSHDAGIWIFPNIKFRVLNNAIDVVKFKYNPDVRTLYRSNLHVEDKLVIGHVGRFFEQKNHKFLVDAFHEVHKQNPDAVLMLVGDGPLRSEIEKRVRELQLTDAVMFLGVREDIPDLMQAMDCFAFPSLYEGLGIVAVEAQAAGMRTFCADVIPEEVKLTELCSFLPIKDPKEWAKAILKADLTRENTTEQIKAAGYDIHTTAKWLEDFYLKAYKKSGKGL